MSDHIFSPEIQRQILDAMGAKILELESGHRPFTHRVHAKRVIHEIEHQHERNLAA